MTTIGEMRAELGVPSDGEPDELEVDQVRGTRARSRRLMLETKTIRVLPSGSTSSSVRMKEVTPHQILRWLKQHSAAEINDIIDTAADKLVAEGMSSAAAAKRLLAATGALHLGMVDLDDE